MMCVPAGIAWPANSNVAAPPCAVRTRPAGRGAASRRRPCRARAARPSARRPSGGRPPSTRSCSARSRSRDLGVPGELVDEEREGRRRGVVAAEEQVMSWSRSSRVGEPVAVLVARLDQHATGCRRRSVPSRAAARRSRRRRAGRARAAPAASATTASPGRAAASARSRCRRRQSARSKAVAGLVRRRPPRGSRPTSARIAMLIARSRIQCVDVDRLAGLPPGQRALGLVDHHRDRRVHPRAVERGHHDPAGAVVVLASRS